MARRIRFFSALSVVALTGALAAGCSGEGEGDGAEGEGAAVGAAQSSGEGEGSEGEGGVAVGDKAAFLSGLFIMEGHLRAGAALYAAGDVSMAKTHMKHPGDEIYASLVPSFSTYGHPGLADDLTALAAAVENGESEADVSARLSAVVAGVDAAIAAADPSLKDMLVAVSGTLSVAGDEFAMAVEDGVVANAHEYQDAFGFISVVSRRLSTLEGETALERNALDLAREQAGLALAAAPGVAIPETTDAEAETIYGAAARVEIAALGL